MGAKASTPATSGQQSPRSRTFSSSSTGVEAATAAAANSASGPHSPAVNSGPQSTNFTAVGSGPGVSNSHHHHSSSTGFLQHRSLGDTIRVSVPGGHSLLINGNTNQSNGPHSADALHYEDLSDMTGAASFVENIALSASAGGGNGLGRAYTATSLPSHIWSFNGIKCPVCSKFVLPDDIECHLVMCLTKPRLSYNEDVLSDAKGECVICLEDLNPGDIIARLPCLCIYHKGCIDRWFEVNRSCPEHPGD